MSQSRFARLALLLAALGVNAAPVLMSSASAQNKDAAPAAPAGQAAQPQADSVRPELFKLLDPSQFRPLLDAKNFTEAKNRITQAEAIQNKTPYENYILNRMKLSLASATNDDQMSITAVEAILASGKAKPEEVPNFQAALGNYYYNTKNYPKAIESLKQAQASGVTSSAVGQALILSYYLSGDYASAEKAQLPIIEAKEKAGQVPTEQELKIYATSANKVKDEAGYLNGVEKLATYYPNDDYWLDTISRGIARRPGWNDNNITDLLRFEFFAVKKMAPEAYADLGELALKDGFPTEAKKVVDAGFAAGVLGTGSNAAAHRQLRDRATKQAADDAKTIAGGEAAAAKGKNGAGLVNIGWAYVTMDQYDKGIGFIEQGIAKGGLKSPDEAKLRLGMAYARAGQKDKAIQTFETVKAGGGLSDIAKYWILLLKHPRQDMATK